METQVQVANRIDFTQDQVTLIKRQIAPKATDDELKLFLYQAKRTGLDPLARQIYCIHRKAKDGNGNWIERMTVQTSIDGFRVIAERSGDYGGQEEPEFVEKDGAIICCKVPIYRFRGDVRYKASVGVAYWNEYVPKEGQDSMWRKMPHTMISKVAEALALRKAYPQDLSGLYTTEEMQQAGNGEQQPEQQQETQLTQVDPAKTCDELKAEFMSLYEEYVQKSGDPSVKSYHPDNWKKEQNVNTFTAAIAAIKLRLNGLSGRANVDEGLLGRIETLIWHSSLDEKQKAREMKRMLRLGSMEEAYKMLNFLQDFQPIVGIHRAPMTQYESVEATRLRVDRENFKERKK